MPPLRPAPERLEPGAGLFLLEQERVIMRRTRLFVSALAALLLLCVFASTAWSMPTLARRSFSRPTSSSRGISPGPAEMSFDPSSGTVHVKLSPADLNSVPLSDLRRDRFAVFENGVRQQDVNVDIEHAPVTLAVLFEHGGRSYQLNRAIASDAEYIVRPLLGMLERDDK